MLLCMSCTVGPRSRTDHLAVCPSCSNLLTIRAIPYGDLCDEDKSYAGRNAFECQTCPYQMYLDKQYFERKKMEAKAVEDVLGGADSWKNVDKTSGMCIGTWAREYMLMYTRSELREPEMRQRRSVFQADADQKCRRAYDYILQGKLIRSCYTISDLLTRSKCTVCGADWREN